MTGPPPNLPLFPTPPLSRSAAGAAGTRRRIERVSPTTGVARGPARPGRGPANAAAMFQPLESEDAAIPDRKSTRLNSSHSQISYAVFCLKKKKKNHKCFCHSHQLSQVDKIICIMANVKHQRDDIVSIQASMLTPLSQYVCISNLLNVLVA